MDKTKERKIMRKDVAKRVNIARTNPPYFIYKWCGGWDSNPRRPESEDLKSSPLSKGAHGHLFRPGSGTPATATKEIHRSCLSFLHILNAVYVRCC